MVRSAHSQGEGILQRCDYQEVGSPRDPLRACPHGPLGESQVALCYSRCSKHRRLHEAGTVYRGLRRHARERMYCPVRGGIPSLNTPCGLVWFSKSLHVLWAPDIPCCTDPTPPLHSPHPVSVLHTTARFEQMQLKSVKLLGTQPCDTADPSPRLWQKAGFCCPGYLEGGEQGLERLLGTLLFPPASELLLIVVLPPGLSCSKPPLFGEAPQKLKLPKLQPAFAEKMA